MSDHTSTLIGSYLFFLIFLALLGLKTNKRLLGVLIDSRGKMSLSRLQLTLWTILIVSSIFSVSIVQKSMNIMLPSELWILMGISLGSATGSVIIKGVKGAQEPSAAYLESAGHSIKRTGLLHSLEGLNEARFIDMFKGEEISDYQYADISKVQMFFFTLAAWIGYFFTIYTHDFVVGNDGIIVFPVLSQGIVTLIGVSHAGYVAIKASDKTPKN